MAYLWKIFKISNKVSLTTFVHVFLDTLKNIYLFLRDRDIVRAGEGQKVRGRQNVKQAPGTEPDVGLKPTNCEIMT